MSRNPRFAVPRGTAKFLCLAVIVTTSACAEQPSDQPSAPIVSGSSSSTTDSSAVLWFTMDDQPLGSEIVSLRAQGPGSVNVDVVSDRGGEARIVAGRPGAGGALRPPVFDADGPRAIIRVTSRSSPDGIDPLSPRTRPFTIAADVSLDAGPTRDASVTSTDDGDNVVQRGLAGKRAQYKIQVDRGRPSCQIIGSAGRALVTGPALIPNSWYRLSCTRDAETVIFHVTAHGSDGVTGKPWSKKIIAPTGDLNFTAPEVPLSIGGKLTNDGKMSSETDQFNGLIDAVQLQIS
ncbi:MAG: hypothetical protein ACRCTR_05475 [Actinomycetota bacterium]